MPEPSAPHRARSPAPRRVAELAFTEILVIWALRRFASCSCGSTNPAAAIAAEFSRALGLAQLEASLAAFTDLADSLLSHARLPQAVSLVEDDRVSATEEAVLSVLAAFQQGEEARAQALGEWCLLAAGRARFLDGAGQLARRLAEAGHKLPDAPPHHRRLVLAAEAADDKLLDSTTDTGGLQAAERGLIAGARLWVAAFRKNHDPLGAARSHFDALFNDPEGGSGVLRGDRRSGEEAGLALHAILRNTSLAAARPVDLRCANCRGLSPDEARLLQATAWLQRDQPEPARIALGDWLPAGALRLTLKPAQGLAHSLLAAELVLPLRDWDYPALAAAQEAYSVMPGSGDAGTQPPHRLDRRRLH